MKITSESFSNGKAIAAEFAMGQPIGDGFGFAGNRNPHFTFAEVPTAARSLALLCVDSDVPTVAEMVGKAGVEIPVDQPRCDFVHWLMIDIPGDCRAIAAGACSDGVTAHGKHAPAGPRGSRQGLNDYTAWFAADPDMAGDYLGYDGPFPPPNDLRLHRYFFRLFALDCAKLAVPERFAANDVQRAMKGHVLAEAAMWGGYALHPRVR
ncbi:MAG: YbhB/YbcL family Raf kinase inhibitor-like protein [Lysobacterales bacterium CG17_big_fil_post_rev_8_21_14_2_50_64_11]|nr:MAG: YbhB/YbcL family Raf kinase inhibitor-like protein [Xanthomonadales bacterium CG17_big_fil_post_rev_8_21_14_2_50_64_11]PIX61291.1 MAG: YbhB/YbcL family Raf kinase inhibitor-like protein [Xanthomonadales bacterium CG_4_10_14_3_um_filter_64_11]